MYSEDIKDKLSDEIKKSQSRSPHDLLRELRAAAGGINFSVPPKPFGSQLGQYGHNPLPAGLIDMLMNQ